MTDDDMCVPNGHDVTTQSQSVDAEVTGLVDQLRAAQVQLC